MKSTLLRLSVLLLTFSVGVAIPQFFKRHRSGEPSLPVSSSGVASLGCPSPEERIFKGGQIVISVPNDTDFYIGKRKVALAEIPDNIRRMVGMIRTSRDQVVLIKSAASVRLETLSLIIDKVREGGAPCVDFIMDKKKGGLK